MGKNTKNKGAYADLVSAAYNVAWFLAGHSCQTTPKEEIQEHIDDLLKALKKSKLNKKGE